MEGAPAQPAVVALATDCCSCSGKRRGGRRGAGGWGKGRDGKTKIASPSQAGVGGGVPGAPHPRLGHHLGFPIPDTGPRAEGKQQRRQRYGLRERLRFGWGGGVRGNQDTDQERQI